MKKSPGIAVLISVFIPGGGNMYCDEIFKGIVYLILTPIGYFCFILPGIILHICSLVSAYNGANRVNRRYNDEVEQHKRDQRFTYDPVTKKFNYSEGTLDLPEWAVKKP